MIVSATDFDLPSFILDMRWKRRILADGDSWFSVGGFTGNLLMPLDDADTLIVNCAYPGDELEDSSAIGNDLFASLLHPTDGMPRWDMALLSAGGNDILKRCGQALIREPGDWFDNDILFELLSDFERHLVRFLRTTQACQPGVPVFCHTYDYPPVSHRWWFWKLGPWIAPQFKAAGIPRELWDSHAGLLIDALSERMLAVAEDYPVLNVVDTRHLLAAGDWQNEIHPSLYGYSVIARRLRAGINSVLTRKGTTP